MRRPRIASCAAAGLATLALTLGSAAQATDPAPPGKAAVKPGSVDRPDPGPESEDPSALVKKFASTNSQDVLPAGRALVRMGKRAVPALREGLNDTNPQVKAYSALALQGIGREAAGALDDLIRILKLPSSSVTLKTYVLNTLGTIGPAAAGASRAIADVMNNRGEDPGLRNIAARALGAIGPAAADYVDDLDAILKDSGEEENVRLGAVIGLIGIGPAAARAAGDLIKVARDRGQNQLTRQKAISALRESGAATPEVVTALRDLAIDRGEDPKLRVEAIYALGSFREAAADVAPDLLAGLTDPDDQVRLHTAYALGRIPPKVGDMAGILLAQVNAARGPRDPVGFIADQAFGLIVEVTLRAPGKLTAPQLDQIAALSRKARDFVAGYIGPADVKLILAEGSVGQSLNKGSTLENFDHLVETINVQRFNVARAADDLVKVARDRGEDQLARQRAIFALRVRGEAAPEVVTALRDLAIDRGEDPKLRVEAIYALSVLGEAAADVAPDLLAGLTDPDDQVRLHTAYALKSIPPKTSDVLRLLPALVNAAREPNDPVGAGAVEAFGAIVGDTLNEPEKFTAAQLDQIAALSRRARDFVAGYIGPADVKLTIEEGSVKASNTEHIDQKRDLKDFDDLIAAIDDERWWLVFSKSYDWLVGHPNVYVPLLLAAVLLLAWLFLLAVRPLWLLALKDLLKPTEIVLPAWLSGVTVSLDRAILIRLFVFNRRVLDAWVKMNAPKGRERYQDKVTVKARMVFVDTSLERDGTVIPRLTLADLRPTFRRNRCCLLIWGEGGSGKTSLACEIARRALSPDKGQRPVKHVMLPILIEGDIPAAPEGKRPFLEAVRKNLSELTDQEEPIAEDLVERLLRRRRLLVIVDHFSELSETTRAMIHPEDPDFPANALIVTSRPRAPRWGGQDHPGTPPRPGRTDHLLPRRLPEREWAARAVLQIRVGS
jgi:HEAT repeat protein